MLGTVRGEPLVILLVEDNPDHTELIVRSFQDHLVINKIYHVSDGRDALDYMYRQGAYADPGKSPRPHIILLDLRLPKVDGLEVLRQLKQSDDLCRIPVVIITTSEAERDIAMAYDNHANSYLVKPVDFQKFTQLMEDLGFYWLGWNRHPWPRSDPR
jgi:CheY-like chemotaxis protein